MRSITAALLALLLTPCLQGQEQGFTSIFNGEDLEGWEGKPGWWSVQDGAITAASTLEKPCRKHNYLMWRGGQPTDFELRFSFRLQGGNSGVQFRSQELPGWDTRGYQADMDAADEWTGALFEHARGGIAMRNEDVHIAADGTRRVSALGDPDQLLQSIRHDDWNEYRVLALGSEIQLFLNDVLMSRVIDEQAERRGGVIALQMHPGPPMQVQFKDLRLKVLDQEPGSATPSWIWSGEGAEKGEVRHFRREFTLAGPVERARLFTTCDDEMVVWLDGEQVALGNLWSTPVLREFEWKRDDLPGARHVLAATGRNGGPGAAAFLLQLSLEGPDGATQVVQTDDSWSVSAQDAPGWRAPDFDDDRWSPAQVVGALGDAPWTSITARSLAGRPSAGSPGATPADQLEVMDGFEVELLYSPPKRQGSWVSMCVDDAGRFIVSDQYNGGLYRVTPPSLDGKPEDTVVEKIPVDLSSAQGLLWAFDSLYVLVSKNGKYDSGLYRVRDRDGDGELDQVELLRGLGGGGDHGWHGLVLGPDGDSIYVAAGNATEPPELSSSRVPEIWGEDLLATATARRGRIHDEGAWRPAAASIAWTGMVSNWELISAGYRNPYDAAFHRDGDLFTFDADMEWDMNTPWYRPTRVCLVDERQRVWLAQRLGQVAVLLARWTCRR